MYESYYHLKTKPFSLLPDPDFLYLGVKHKLALSLLEYGLLNQAGFIVITGEPGTGKTTLLQKIIQDSNTHCTIGAVSNTHDALGSLLPWILAAFDQEAAGSGAVELAQRFSAFLADEAARHHRVVLLIDEAQNLTPSMLEELRLLSNTTSGKSQLLQIVLSGQPRPGVRHASDEGPITLDLATPPTIVAAMLSALAHRQSVVNQLKTEVKIARRFQGGLRGEIDRIHEELQLAASVQREFLPRSLPHAPSIDIQILFRPAGYVSGDIYDVIRLDEHTLGWADFRGNRQYVSVGNLTVTDRVSLFLMDYANRRRLKIFGHAELRAVGADEGLAARLSVPGYEAVVERAVIVRVAGFDWNCPQHITPRFTRAEVERVTLPLRERLAELEARLA